MEQINLEEVERAILSDQNAARYGMATSSEGHHQGQYCQRAKCRDNGIRRWLATLRQPHTTCRSL